MWILVDDVARGVVVTDVRKSHIRDGYHLLQGFRRCLRHEDIHHPLLSVLTPERQHIAPRFHLSTTEGFASTRQSQEQDNLPEITDLAVPHLLLVSIPSGS